MPNINFTLEDCLNLRVRQLTEIRAMLGLRDSASHRSVCCCLSRLGAGKNPYDDHKTSWLRDGSGGCLEFCDDREGFKYD